ncbi:hypothetical protein BCU68_10355 [Vibrio sp. 10N.286.49.B3]|uniref:DUF494 family protein n=1 Tax=Vibrio sp. 10N.286.49.B3 TaxID=1880855 RepID=UPI000C84E118|nr:DUF494 family protein [Vibrio sp. 10N.286.49.B3]PMH45380.1 hypothetical protein BCU68_10355 [Vibrio sp. 10N.286.49.B3]
MMDILMYLFETYIHSDVDLEVEQDEIAEELLRAGFLEADIYQALEWLEGLASLQQTDTHAAISKGSNQSIRIYTEKELARINIQCRGFILFLEQVKVLSTEVREMVIDRLMELDTYELSLDDLKWIVLMVLFNVPGNESAYSQMENLLHSSESGLLH